VRLVATELAVSPTNQADVTLPHNGIPDMPRARVLYRCMPTRQVGCQVAAHDELPTLTPPPPPPTYGITINDVIIFAVLVEQRSRPTVAYWFVRAVTVLGLVDGAYVHMNGWTTPPHAHHHQHTPLHIAFGSGRVPRLLFHDAGERILVFCGATGWHRFELVAQNTPPPLLPFQVCCSWLHCTTATDSLPHCLLTLPRTHTPKFPFASHTHTTNILGHVATCFLPEHQA